MGIDRILTDYDRLATIATSFAQCSQDSHALYNGLRSRAEALMEGGWEGRGAAAFGAEMSNIVLPALQRLGAVLAVAQNVAQEAAQTMQVAEQEAAGHFQPGGGASVSQGALASTQPSGGPAGGSPDGGPAQVGASYSADALRPYGPSWKNGHPPGLPAEARQASASGAALPFVERSAQTHNLGDTFVRTVMSLAKTESGATFARPADKFDNRPPEQRNGRPIVTAWGVFQFNRDAWRALPGTGSNAFPWNCTPQEEIERPVARYAELFRNVKATGGSNLDAARGIRLWQRSPAQYKRFVNAGEQNGFALAWAAVPTEHRAKVDNLLDKAGIR